jgi:tRNA(adenine34) deaminase
VSDLESAADSAEAESCSTDERWMREAMSLADEAAAVGDVPVGCVVVGPDGVRWGTGKNAREEDQDPTAHAELLALRAAAKHRGAWRLEGATVYVTLEPCAMCAGALVLARVARVVFGCTDPKGGACTTLYSIGDDVRLNHRFALTGQVLEADCAAQLKSFFAALRKNKKSATHPSSDGEAT